MSARVVPLGFFKMTCDHSMERAPVDVQKMHNHRLPWAYIVGLALLPPIVVLFVFGSVPLDEPNTGQKPVFIYFTNPISASIISATLMALFFSLLDRDRPARRHHAKNYLMVLLVYAAEVLFFHFVYRDRPTFELMGLISAGLLVLVTFLGLFTLRLWMWPCGCSFYLAQLRRYAVHISVFFAYIVVLALWVCLNTVILFYV